MMNALTCESIILKQASPRWKEEQHRRGYIFSLAVAEVPQQSHWHRTCNKDIAEDVSMETDNVDAIDLNESLFNPFR